MTTILPIFAKLPPALVFEVAASAAVGLALATAAWWLFGVLRSDDLQQGIEWRYDVSRINELRRIDPFYRLFQPAIQMLGRWNRRLFANSLPAITHDIQAAGCHGFGWLRNTWVRRS